MPRIAGVNIPENKKINIALTYIYGIGHSRANEILKKTGIPSQKRAKELTPEEIARLRDFVERSYKLEGELRREVQMNIKRLKDIGTYRGSRHIKRLPVRGQRTRTNSRTVRGNVRKPVGSGRKPPPEKT
ncbi:MAG: 30S ribosomal protein S13 [Candidatus Paceibacteria bacterium]